MTLKLIGEGCTCWESDPSWLGGSLSMAVAWASIGEWWSEPWPGSTSSAGCGFVMSGVPIFMKLSFPWPVPSSALDVGLHFVRGSEFPGNGVLELPDFLADLTYSLTQWPVGWLNDPVMEAYWNILFHCLCCAGLMFRQHFPFLFSDDSLLRRRRGLLV
jgi:hypothetical protein